MKHKICITVDTETLDIIRYKIRDKTFRNRSHAFEYSIKMMNDTKKENDENNLSYEEDIDLLK